MDGEQVKTQIDSSESTAAALVPVQEKALLCRALENTVYVAASNAA
jgi:hypothetical protein